MNKGPPCPRFASFCRVLTWAEEIPVWICEFFSRPPVPGAPGPRPSFGRQPGPRKYGICEFLSSPSYRRPRKPSSLLISAFAWSR